MNIERETFEAWLLLQWPGRQFNYMDVNECAGCCFIRETTSFSNPVFGSHDWADASNHGVLYRLPDWFILLLRAVTRDTLRWTFTAGELQAVYTALFPASQINLQADDLVEEVVRL